MQAALRAMAERALAGTVPPRELARWAHRAFGHGTLDLAERLVELDDIYDTLAYADLTEQGADAEVIDEARQIVAATVRP